MLNLYTSDINNLNKQTTEDYQLIIDNPLTISELKEYIKNLYQPLKELITNIDLNEYNSISQEDLNDIETYVIKFLDHLIKDDFKNLYFNAHSYSPKIITSFNSEYKLFVDFIALKFTKNSSVGFTFTHTILDFTNPVNIFYDSIFVYQKNSINNTENYKKLPIPEKIYNFLENELFQKFLNINKEHYDKETKLLFQSILG